MPQIIIPDTSLCTIVRDEATNSAGGIVDFVNSTIPFLEAGVILDTGSIDGTREILEELALKYPHLEVINSRFFGYAYSRNFALRKVKTKMAFVLDADERLTEKDFEQLLTFMKKNPSKGYNFGTIEIYPDDEIGYDKTGHNPRLFEVSDELRYRDIALPGEHLCLGNRIFEEIPRATFDTQIKIKHFLPSKKSIQKKWQYLYSYRRLTSLFREIFGISTPPSKLPYFHEWKAYNPKRDLYR